MSHRIIIDRDASLLSGNDLYKIQNDAYNLSCSNGVEKVEVYLTHTDHKHEEKNNLVNGGVPK